MVAADLIGFVPVSKRRRTRCAHRIAQSDPTKEAAMFRTLFTAAALVVTASLFAAAPAGASDMGEQGVAARSASS